MGHYDTIITIIKRYGHARAIFQGVTIAETRRWLEYHGDIYFPPDAVKEEFLELESYQQEEKMIDILLGPYHDITEVSVIVDQINDALTAKVAIKMPGIER
ncbi:Fc.00g090010.m01.CDS01 [Cosmosporella sp. VM-42]